jgi:hypothetical protein
MLQKLVNSEFANSVKEWAGTKKAWSRLSLGGNLEEALHNRAIFMDAAPDHFSYHRVQCIVAAVSTKQFWLQAPVAVSLVTGE